MKIQGVLFDMDGVLLDTERLDRDLIPKDSLALGYPMSEETFNSLLGINADLSRKILAEVYGADYPYDEVMSRHIVTFLDMARKGEMPVKRGVAECMAGLAERGLKRALVTSTSRDVVETYIANIPELQGVFDVVICGAEAGRSKPEPDIYLEAASRLGLAPQSCVGVEDSLNGVKSLTAAGCVSVMVPDLLPYDEKFHGFVDYVLDDLTRLCPLIDRLENGGRIKG